MSNTKHLADLVKVCSILPALVIMPAMVNAAERQEFVAGEKVTITNQSVSGHKETENWAGGLFLVSGGSELTIQGGSYTNNANNTVLYKDDGSVSARGAGGVVGQGKGVVNVTDYNGARAQFIGNSALAAGGALWLGRQADIKNADFIGNDVVGVADPAGVSIDGGGALFLGASSTTVIDDVLFKSNSSAVEGGAISMRSAEQGNNSQAKLDIFDSDFIDNHAATNGGAIYSTFYDSETVKDSVYIYDTDFSLNSAQRGGAIYTEGLADLGGGLASMKIVDADFEGNTATAEGGAIHNRSSLIVLDSEFVGNIANGYYGGAVYNAKTGSISLLDADFVENKVFTESYVAEGGALFSAGSVGSLTGVFDGNIAQTVSNDTWASAKAGAVSLYAGAAIDSVIADFTNNSAISTAEAIGGAVVNGGNIGKLYQKGQGFVNNVADAVTNGWAGALYNSQNATIGELVADFKSNSTTGTEFATGGALVNRGQIDLLSGTFTNNSLTNAKYAQGGAIYNGGDASSVAQLTIVDSAFANNFVDSVDADWAAGGAIYNELNSFVTMKGTNTFTGNTVNGKANDIYNDGTFTIASGMTSIDGGINGAGALDIKSDATLNINYASIEQDTINIDGTLMASLLNDKDVVDITGALSGTGTVLLSAGTTGTYDVSLFADANLGVDFGKTYDVEFNYDKTKATLTTRDAQSIAADTGASIAAAGAVSGLAASTDATIQQVSLRAQAALNNGDIALVEKEMAKANPDTKPVSQSVAASVQNQVVTMAAGRMSAIGGGATGRAGGDVTGAGVWTQGMFNKSKFADKFHGYTRGFAIGGDTLIDNVLTIGGGYAFSNSDIHADGRNMDVENNSIFMYAQYKPAAWYVNATLNYTKSDYADASTVFGYLLNDEYETKSYGAQAMFGYDFANGVTPEFGMRYLHVSQEYHVDVMNREIAGMDADFLSGVAGLKYAFTIESDSAVKFSPTMRAAMTYDFLSDDATATVVMPGASAYYVDVDRLSRLGGEFGIGLTAEYRGLEVSLNYELDLHQDYTSQTGLLKFRYDF